MRKKRTWRYYCDYCKKSGCSQWHMERHEKRCTMNPDRECGMCRISDGCQEPMSKLIAALGCGDTNGLKRLRDLAEGCPVCMLAAIRQSKVQEPKPEDEYYPQWVDFSFKEERKAFLAEVNAERTEDY